MHKTVSKSWIGKWQKLQEENQRNGELEISSISGDSIKFLLSASSGGNSGEIEGIAIVEGNIGKYSYSDEFDDCIIDFYLYNDSLIEVSQKKGNCSAGLSVTYSGNYRNKKLVIKEKKFDLINLGIFKNETENNIFKKLVSNNYSLFVESTQVTSEDEDLDNLNARVYSSGVNGLYTFMENIIMIDESNNIWAAVINDDKVYYYTNSKEYIDEIPKTIDNWRERFKDYEIIYNQM